MKTSYYSAYGSSGAIQLKDIPMPHPAKGELLIKVMTTTVNRTDCALLTAKPPIMRLFTGLVRPRKKVLGTDFAGIVEETGEGITQFSPGDTVFGFDDMGLQSQAEYMILKPGKPVMKIPEGVTFENAVAGIEGGHYAINFINKLALNSGNKVLVYGATGAIGSAAVQLLKARGVYVTAVGNTPNMELLKRLGADKVIDYLQEDFTQHNEKYDYVFDAVGKSTFSKCRVLLKPRGVYLSSELGFLGQNLFYSLFTPFKRFIPGLKSYKRVVFPVPSNINASLKEIADLLAQGQYHPVIDQTFEWEQLPAAYTYVLSGQKTGNVLLKINE